MILLEDAMLVHRIVRAPGRKVFYIDVGNVPPEEVPNYMEQVQTTLKRSQVVDKQTGRVDLRYNPLSVDEDYFLPVRGTETGTKIDTLAGGTNQNDINDVEYVQKKLFAALKVPKAYLGYDEALSSKATLAQEDIRFSRSIARIQRTIIAELNKIAIITLYVKGYTDDDLIDFDLRLSNPSTIAQQQKLELFRSKFEIAGVVPEGLVDKRWIRKHIIGLTDENINDIEEGRESDKLRELEIESMTAPGAEGGGDGGGSAPGGVFGAPGGDIFGGGDDAGGGEEADDAGGEEPTPDAAGTETAGYTPRSDDLLTSKKFEEMLATEVDDDDDDLLLDEDNDEDDEGKPISPSNRARTDRNNRSRRAGRTGNPDFKLHDPASVRGSKRSWDTGSDELRRIGKLSMTESDGFLDDFFDTQIDKTTKFNNEIRSVIKNLGVKISNNASVILNESLEDEDK